jgi:hypothetical protein
VAGWLARHGPARPGVPGKARYGPVRLPRPAEAQLGTAGRGPGTASNILVGRGTTRPAGWLASLNTSVRQEFRLEVS